MNVEHLLPLLSFGLLLAGGCARKNELELPAKPQLSAKVRSLLQNADQIVLWSIQTDDEGDDNTDEFVSETMFHGYPIIGKTEITDEASRNKIVQSLLRRVDEVQHGPAMCFWPRHGLSAKSEKGHVDLVIYFECLGIVSFSPERQSVAVSESPRDVFNEALIKANVMLAK